jgi:NhaA family Na+:H+ antiporter
MLLWQAIFGAIFNPRRCSNSQESPLKELEHDLHHVVAFFVLPVFSFANGGITLTEVTTSQVSYNVPLNIAAGLIFVK